MKEKKIKLIEQVKSHFPGAGEKDFEYNRLDFNINKESVSSILFFLKEEMGYIHLSL